MMIEKSDWSTIADLYVDVGQLKYVQLCDSVVLKKNEMTVKKSVFLFV